MPELPDIETYLTALQPRVVGQALDRIRIASPFVLRSVDPAPDQIQGLKIHQLSRLGKRVVFHLEQRIHIVVHLMIAGRLRWRPPAAAVPRKLGLAAFDFPTGSLVLTEAGSKKRASIHLVRGEQALAEHDPGGIEPLTCGLDAFAHALRRENHTLKRTLTDPRLLSGIGNAYSDEILHRARLSPVKWTSRLTANEVLRLHEATVRTLTDWIARLRDEIGDGFPEKVTAFREGMAVHGRYGEACPGCSQPVQRIVRADHETNYCPSCQTGGKLLADRALSRLLRGDWPKTLEALEQLKRPA